MIKIAARHTARFAILLFGVLLILLALLTLCVRLGLPLLASEKGSIESRISEYLKSPVEIGELSFRWEGFGPLLQASDVTVIEAENRSVKLDELLIDVNLVKSLLQGTPVINELTLVGADLALESDVNGRVLLHGMQFSDGATSSSQASSLNRSRGVNLAAWLFNARKVGLQDARLTLIDLQSDGQLVIDDLNIRAENEGNLHQLRVDAVLPAKLGGRIEAGIDLIGDAPALDESHGSIFVAADELNWRGLSQLLTLSGLLDGVDLLKANMDARASVKLWGTWQDGRLVSARGPLNITQLVDLNSNETLLDSVSTQLRLVHGEKETTVLANEFVATYGDSTLAIEEILARRLTAPVLDKELSEQHNADQASASQAGSRWRLSAQSKRLPADLGLRLASVGIAYSQPELAAQIREYEVAGFASDVALSVGGSSNEPLVNLGADINEFALLAHPSLPSLGTLSGDISVVNSVGQLQLNAKQMPLQWDSASDQVLNLDDLTSTIDVDLRDPSRLLLSADVALFDNGIETNTRVKARLLAGESPHLDVQSRFSASDITELKAWIPRKILNPVAVEWIDRSITSGQADNGSLLFFGNTADFPFDDGEGVLNGSVDISKGGVKYLPGWPEASNVQGTMELDGLSLRGDVASARLGKFNVSQAQLAIANLGAPVLNFSTTSNGGFESLVEFAVDGPLQSFLEPAIGDLSANGSAEMDLSLTYPLYAKPSAANTVFSRTWRPFTLNGSLFFSGNDVEFGRAGLTLNNARGAVGFDLRGISINSLRGNLLGHPVSIAGKTDGQGLAATTHITIQGSVEANDLLAHYGNPLDQFINGTSQWTAVVSAPHSAQRIADSGVQLSLNSDLVGSQLLVSAPLKKRSATAAPFSLHTAFKTNTDTQIWQADYNNELNAKVRTVNGAMSALLIDIAAQQAATTQPSVSLDGADLAGLDGIRVQGQSDTMAVDGWIDTVASYINSLPSAGGEPTPILPISVALNTRNLTINDVSLGSAELRANTDDTYLNAVISNQALRGNLRYPREHWSKDIALSARLDLLDWSLIDALNTPIEGAVTSNSNSLDPRLLPPIEARVSNLVRDDVVVKDLVIRAQPNVSGLDITTFGFAYDTMRMVGQGSWHLRDPQNLTTHLAGKHLTQLNLVLQSDDFGTGLEFVGLDGILDDSTGSISMNLNWPGPFYKPEIARLDGEVNLDIRDGSIVPLEPEAGRVVGLFAIQALPRRLRFDFKDVTNAGLAFERIAGNAKISDGVAAVPLLQLSGPIGVVDMMGTSDLNTQQFDQTVTVLPRVSAALPVIGAIAGGASGGIGALVATGFLKAIGLDFDRIGLRSYRLQGPWQEPQFTPIAPDFNQSR